MKVFSLELKVGRIQIHWTESHKIARLDLFEDTVFESNQAPLPRCMSHVPQMLRDYFESGAPIPAEILEDVDQSVWTEFQKQVYHAVVRIPHGETRTYGWVASVLGKMNATRAVGQALRNNPVPLLIPCHRVVGAASLGGFMGNDDPEQATLKVKQFLLNIEDQYLNPFFAFVSPAAQESQSAFKLA